MLFQAGFLGYSPSHAKCEFVSYYDYSGVNPYAAVHDFAMAIPCLIILTSYVAIISYTWKLGKDLHKPGYWNKNKHKFNYVIHFPFRSSSASLQSSVNQRNMKMTLTTSLVCSVYLISVTPITLTKVMSGVSAEVYLLTYCIYWLQYSANFFIYAARSEDYRKAYCGFLSKLFCGLFKSEEFRPINDSRRNSRHTLITRSVHEPRRKKSILPRRHTFANFSIRSERMQIAETCNLWMNPNWPIRFFYLFISF